MLLFANNNLVKFEGFSSNVGNPEFVKPWIFRSVSEETSVYLEPRLIVVSTLLLSNCRKPSNERSESSPAQFQFGQLKHK